MDTPTPDDAASPTPLPPPSLSPQPDAASYAPPDLAGGYVPPPAPAASPAPPAGYPASYPPAVPPPPYAAPPAASYPPPPLPSSPYAAMPVQPPYAAVPGQPPYGAPQPAYPPPSPYGYQPYTYATNPDGPAAGLRYAGFGVRTLAYIVDAIVLLVLSLIASVPMGGFLQDTSTTVNGVVQTVPQANPAVQLFSTLIGAIYFVGFWTAMGRTPGQRLLRLRVVRAADGRPLGIGQALGRYLGLLVSFLVIGLGVIWVALDPRRQGWHDKMANTFVVQETQ